MVEPKNEEIQQKEQDSLSPAPADESDSIITAHSFLIAQADLEREAAELLPGKFDTCTFDQGYIHQPLYACLTCTHAPKQYQQPSVGTTPHSSSEREETDPAGMCYSCSIECHAGHQVIELFTKRHFRCDCGTKRLAAATGLCCRLKSGRNALVGILNEQNAYGHNFWGHYCRCDKYYDAEKEVAAMVQCYVCSDCENDFDAYMCREWWPPTLRVAAPAAAAPPAAPAPALAGEDDVSGEENGNSSTKVIVPDSAQQDDTKLDDIPEPAHKRPRQTLCRLRQDKAAIDAQQPSDLFLSDGWKGDICTCLECMRSIETSGLSFLLGKDDIVEPEEDDTRGESLYEAAMAQMARMDRTQAVNAAAAYHTLSSRLKDYLRPFAASGKVVTDADIGAFFAQQQR
ncbi:hypothetical protein BX661DRAFT_198820 [Kickxella alabastrina]|uniref:uncharacterized protein n=1 Tax=Kickxella alabastrina TaxID=61397 RepID=UPI00222064E0|nr:uncharacterized protein BX661DRAFT_198820 [Kickxella alabastrina]KAI7826811.1 hypothetical protein BX661DRAFT_198820 [Kickxella alabastrina]